ncbi:MAG: hypothetical protein ACI9GW_001145, partial [Halieaceae bacterium]
LTAQARKELAMVKKVRCILKITQWKCVNADT